MMILNRAPTVSNSPDVNLAMAAFVGSSLARSLLPVLNVSSAHATIGIDSR